MLKKAQATPVPSIARAHDAFNPHFGYIQASHELNMWEDLLLKQIVGGIALSMRKQAVV